LPTQTSKYQKTIIGNNANRDEISDLYRRPSIDASYQVSVQLAKQFQGRRFLEIYQSETRIPYGSHVCK